MELVYEHLLPFAHGAFRWAEEVGPVEFGAEDFVDCGIAGGIKLAEGSVMEMFAIVGT